MTRTEGMTSSRSHTAAAIDEMSLPRRARRRLVRRELLALPAALALLVSGAPAVAQATETSSNGTSGYKQKPPTPKTTPEPKKEVEPAKEEKKTTPTPTTTTEPTTTTPTAKAATLPFTGLDLRWVVGAGVILLASGLSIRLTLRGRLGAGR
jgi:uncharacterized membrane protein